MKCVQIGVVFTKVVAYKPNNYKLNNLKLNNYNFKYQTYLLGKSRCHDLSKGILTYVLS
jgi:hypothetical protein